MADEPVETGRERLELMGEPLETATGAGSAAVAAVTASAGLSTLVPPPEEPPAESVPAAVAALTPDATSGELAAVTEPRGPLFTAVGFDEVEPVAPVGPDAPEAANGELTASE
jgi:hypothetical protein